MANYSVFMTGFDHMGAAGCCCPGCCVDDTIETNDLEARLRKALELAGNDAPGLLAMLERMLDRWSGDAPRSDEQQAGRKTVTIDTNTNDADQPVDGLVSGIAWNTTNLTFSFPNSSTDYSDTSSAYHASSFYSLSAAVRDGARAALDNYAEIAPFVFTEITGTNDGDADLRFGGDNGTGTAYAYYPSSNPIGGDSFYGTSVNAPVVGTWDYHTLLHELGHALGLKHGHDTSGPGAIPSEFDSMEYSVMTYRSYEGAPLNGYVNANGDYAQSLMMLDIAAIQRMYGANFGHEAGNTVYTFSTETGRMFVNGVDVIAAAGLTKTNHDTIFRTIWDGNGTDTYDFSNFTTNLGVDLTPGAYVDLDVGGNAQRAALHYNGSQWAAGHVYNAMQFEGDARSLIENAEGGSGNDWFIGNAANNTLWGNGGNDTFYDSAGSDRYHGGDGTDRVEFGGLFSSYSFSISGAFLQVVGAAVDWVADTIEQVVFANNTVWSFSDLWDLASGGGSNTAPVANNDSATTDEDNGVTVNVLGNDTDSDGDALTVSIGTGPSNGSVTVNADKTITYTPDADFNGEDSFTYEISDGNGGTDTATVTVTVNPVNDDPVANNDSDSTNEDQTVTVTVLGNDADADGDGLTVTGASNGANGTTTVNGDGTIDYTPNAGYSGTDQFTYTISDGNGGTDTATVTVTVNPVNDAPVANDDSETVAEDGSVVVAVLDNDTDGDGDTLAVSIGTGPSHGSAVVNADGTITYTPDANYNGPDSFTYAVSDGNGGADTATVSIDVTPVNDDPVAGNDGASVDQDQQVVISVLTNDSDTDGDGLTVESAGDGANGTTAVNPDGTVTYTPNEGFFGTDAFSYTVSDGNGGSDTATVTVTVNEVIPDPVNTDPVAGDDGASTDQDQQVIIAVLANDGDTDGDTLTVTGATNGTNGTTSVNPDGTVTYTPDEGFFGEDTFTYTISDGNGGSDTATVTVTVNEVIPDPVNTDPVAADDSATTDEDNAVIISVLANDGDADGDTLTVTEATDGTNGTTTVNADGTVTYTPNAGFFGVDQFTYTIADGNGGTDTATVTVTVNDVVPPNVDPVAADDSAATDQDTPVAIAVLTNDSDSDGNALTVTGANNGTNGTTSVNPDGTVTYTPNEGFFGEDAFTYTISDGNGGTDTATVTVTVSQDETPPTGPRPVTITFEGMPRGTPGVIEGLAFTDMTVAGSRAINGSRLGYSGNDGDLVITATEGDFDFDGALFRSVRGNATITVEAWDDGVMVGTASFVAGSKTISDIDFGFKSIDQLVIDATGAFRIDDLRLVLDANEDSPAPGNTMPVAEDDTAEVTESSVVFGNVLANDGDAEGSVSVMSFGDGSPLGTVTLDSGAMVTLSADGTFRYDPNGAFDRLKPGKTAVDSFTYTVTDEDGATDTAQVFITVHGEGGGKPSEAITVGFEACALPAEFEFTDTAAKSGWRGVAAGHGAAVSRGDSMGIKSTDGEVFDFEAGWFTAAGARFAKLTIEGFVDGELVATDTLLLNAWRPTKHDLSEDFDAVDELLLTANGGVIVDELSFLV